MALGQSSSEEMTVIGITALAIEDRLIFALSQAMQAQDVNISSD